MLGIDDTRLLKILIFSWTKIKNLDILEDYYCIRILTQKNFWLAFGDVSLGNYESGKLEKYKYI